MQSAHYHCCSNAICSQTYNKFVLRGEKVDILHSQQDTMARVKKSPFNFIVEKEAPRKSPFNFTTGEQ
jgi:hypothetical protein